MTPNVFRFYMEDGSIVEGRVQGAGGEIAMRKDVAAARMDAQMALARRGSSLGIYEPSPGCVLRRAHREDDGTETDLTKVVSFEVLS